MVALDGVTATVATGTGITVTSAVPLFPSLVAVMVAVPGPTAATKPVEVTVATPGALEDQVTDRGSGFPSASRGVAAS